MDENRRKILETCLELYMKFGFRNITMNDIAAKLGISKKTIYQHFDDKRSLIRAVMDFHLERHHGEIEQLKSQAHTPIHELFHLFRFANRQLAGMHPSIMFEMQRYYPEAWAQFERYKKEEILRTIEQNLARGKASGHYRAGINPQILAQFFADVPNLIQQTRERLGEVSLAEVHLHITTHFLYGIATPKGFELIEELENASQEN